MSSPYPPYPPPSSSLSTRFPIKNLSPVGVIFFLIIAVGGSRRLLLLLKECMFARRLWVESPIMNTKRKEKRNGRRRRRRRRRRVSALSFLLLLDEAKVWHFSYCQQTSSPTGNCQVFLPSSLLPLDSLMRSQWTAKTTTTTTTTTRFEYRENTVCFS